jgi:hypothetical protein
LAWRRSGLQIDSGDQGFLSFTSYFLLSMAAFGFEKSALHTRLEACVCFDICFLGASPLRGVGLSAPIPQPPTEACGISAQSLAQG